MSKKARSISLVIVGIAVLLVLAALIWTVTILDTVSGIR